MTTPRMTKIALALAATLTSAACASAPTTMVSNEFLGERTVQYTVREASEVAAVLGNVATNDSDGDEDRYNLFVRLCTLQDGIQTECQTSLVLANVDPTEATNHIHWHDLDTFYVAYTMVPTVGFPQPMVKMCKVQGDNSVECQDQEELNKLLVPTN